jgi:RNA polymerase primary sigma factor
LNDPFDVYKNGFDDGEDDESVRNLSEEDLFPGGDAVETAETKSDSDQEFDPLKSYLKGISTLPLLTKEGEVEIARLIEQGKERIEGALFTIPFIFKKLIMLGRLVENGEAPLIDLIQDGEDLSDEDILKEKERFVRITAEIAALTDKR